MDATEETLKVAMILAEKFRPQKIILFGSRAYGMPRPGSDTDLLVILPFESSSYRMMADMLTAIYPNHGYELVPRTPEDVAERYRWGDPLIRDALDRGIVLYEAAA